MTGVGVDVTSIAGWRARLARTPAVRRSAFTADERSWCGEDPAAFALAWAVKESTVKLLGTGFAGIGWRGVWSRPAGDAGIEVVLGDDARETPAGRDLRGPLRCGLGRDGDRVVVVLVAGSAGVATRTAVFDDQGDRRSRRSASRDAARRAGTAAAAALRGSAAGGARWLGPAGGAPSVAWPDGSTAAASCAHDAGLACAAVAREQGSGSSESQRSGKLTFCYDVSLGICWANTSRLDEDKG